MTVVVVVEDDPRVAEFYIELLMEVGYAARLFLDSASFLEAFGTLSLDLLVLDWNMPEFDGLEVARRVRARRPGVPILMISGALGVAPPGAAGIIDRFLNKPCTIQQFLSAVSALLAPPGPARGESPSGAGG